MDKTARRNVVVQGMVLLFTVLFLVFTIVYAMYVITNVQTHQMDDDRQKRLNTYKNKEYQVYSQILQNQGHEINMLESDQRRDRER